MRDMSASSLVNEDWATAAFLPSLSFLSPPSAAAGSSSVVEVVAVESASLPLGRYEPLIGMEIPGRFLIMLSSDTIRFSAKAIGCCNVAMLSKER